MKKAALRNCEKLDYWSDGVMGNTINSAVVAKGYYPAFVAEATMAE